MTQTPLELSKTGEIPYDPELEKIFPLLQKQHPVSNRDIERHFPPAAVRYLLSEGAIPYLYDVNTGHVTFAIEESRYYEAMSPDDFRTQFPLFFSSLTPGMKRMLNEDKFTFEPMAREKMEKIAPYIINPEKITNYSAERDREKAEELGLVNDVKMQDYTNSLINKAIEMRASDIHLECLGGLERRVRFRIDGKLREIPNLLSPPAYKGVVVVLKNRCGSGVSASETRRPQDGKVVHKYSSKDGSTAVYDLRAAFRPVHSEGDAADSSSEQVIKKENVTLRIPQKRGTFLKLNKLGLSEYDSSRMLEALDVPNGIALITGPTGSGKTTTIYGLLDVLNTPDKKILSIEDPIECQVNGIQQTQVHNEIGVTFASFLRGALRADPDIIFVGEIRDNETADAAIQAAMTGHYVISTLHTNDAPGAVDRLRGMGIQRQNLAGTLRGVMAQSLVRVFENDLRERILSGKLTDSDKEHIQSIDGGAALNALIRENLYPTNSFYFMKGDETTFKGRQALTEFWFIDGKSQDVIANERTGVAELVSTAKQSGMRPMFISGVEKVFSGVTSLEEVLSETGPAVFRIEKEALLKAFNPQHYSN